MKFSMAFISALAALAVSAPTGTHQKHAGVLGAKTYDELSISARTAGNAKQEALDVFCALDLTNMATVAQEDIDFLGAVNDIANDAETGVFNPAIEAATGDEKTALTNGKTKNKVLKLTATSLELQIKAAQEDTAAKLAAKTKKLNNNIALDTKAAGEPSTALKFDATTAA